MEDPFHVIAAAIDHDENKPNALEVLQVPLETGKLYHNEKLFFRALSHLRRESRAFRPGWWMPFASSTPSWNNELNENDHEATTGTIADDPTRHPKERATDTASRQNSSRGAAITPIILTGLLAALDDSNFPTLKECSSCAKANNQDSIRVTAKTNTTTSTELVHYTVGMRRAAMARVRLKIKRERTQRIVKPVLAIVSIIGLYCYAWSCLQRLLVGFYGVTNSVFAPPEKGSSNPIEHQVELLRLSTSPCRSRANADHYGSLSAYAKACRTTEANTFELLTSPHNSRHTKLFARTAYDEIDAGSDRSADGAPGDDESLAKLSAALTQYDDEYGDDKELPFYAMHTVLGDNESSIIPLEEVIHGRKKEREKPQQQRWRRRRRRQRKYKQQQHQRNDELESDNSGDIAAAHARLSEVVQFWGDTTVNHLVREAIVEAHYNDPSLSSPPKTSRASNDKRKSKKLKLLDVGSGLSGTLFSLCTPEFPFEDWSYHGIAISQPEVRRAKQLVDTVIRPIISSASKTEYSRIENSGDHSVDDHDGDASNLKSFPLSNITIQRASFDDPLPPSEYTTMVAVESLAYSHNITITLINLARSLKPKGTLIIIEDVVAPWTVVNENDENSSSYNDYVQHMIEYSGKRSLLTHEKWLESFAAADLTLYRPPRDLMLEFDALSLDTPSTTTSTAVTGLPFVGILIGERPWYSIGHGVLKIMIDWFGRGSGDGEIEEDDGNLSNRALYLMEDLMKNEQGNVYRRAAHHRADLGYYMYICTKR
jgi:hypothetical protein